MERWIQAIDSIKSLAVPKSHTEYRWAAQAITRGLGFICLMAFASLLVHLPGLFLQEGLLPVELFVPRLIQHFGSLWETAMERPSLLLISSSDAFMVAMAWIGVVLSLMMISGFSHLGVLILIWIIYISFVHVGQIFYGYGWETMTLEVSFLALFLAPARSFRLSSKTRPPSPVMMWWFRWLAFRVMFGAGLIKLRGDACWRDLTCLIYHYETQPIPNPLSWYFHNMPVWFHKAGVLSNHFVELIVPFFLFAPKHLRRIGGALIIAFQLMLIFSGNLSWLNWLTIVICFACFDDDLIRKLFRRPPPDPELTPAFNPSRIRWVVVIGLSLCLGVLSWNPVCNMVSPKQAMNRSFDPLHLMNTYGAFGSVGQRRLELIIEGARDERLTANTEWNAYEFPGKPGRLDRRPSWIAPFQYRLDWQIWFAAMQNPNQNPWLIHLVYKLLSGSDAQNALIAENPFTDEPPKYIRIRHFVYSFTPPERKDQGWWEREYVQDYLPPLSLDNPNLKTLVKAYGWE